MDTATTLNDCINQWFTTKDEEKAQAFDLMLQHWKPEEVIGRLAELRFNDIAGMAKWIQNAASLKYDGHPIKTIATLSNILAYGGLERVVCLLCQIWLEMGYKVIVLTELPPTDDDYTLPDSVERIVLPSPSFSSVKAENYAQRAAALSKIIKDNHIDAVISHSWGANYMLWDELAFKTAGAAFIVHHHSIFSRPLSDGWNFSNYAAPYSLADAVVSINEIGRQFWKYYNENSHVTINPLTEDLTEWTPAPYQPNHQILWLARLNINPKCCMDLIPIMEDVVSAVPDAELHIVGKSEDGSVEAAMQAEIAQRHLEEHIILEGFHTDVKPWYRDSQIFLMTSAFEGYPMTLTESKLAGLPCVMYELPYLTLCEGNRGILPVPQRDTKAAAQAVITLLTDDKLCAQMGRDARAHIEELARFDFKGKWHQIFESVEHPKDTIVPATDRLMMDTIIAHHETGLQKAREIRDAHIRALQQELASQQQLVSRLQQELLDERSHAKPKGIGAAIKKTAKVLVPNRAKPFIKGILRRIPQGAKRTVKRLLQW